MTELHVEGLRLETVRAGRAIPLVAGIDLTLRQGCVTALVGASGSGKSLSCLALQGLTPPGVCRAAGRIALNDGAARRPPERGRDIATVMQNPRSAFNPVMTMRAHARETWRGPADRFDAELLRAAGEVGLDVPRDLGLYPFQMSGGMLQRMMIALALLSGAPFLVADEPTTDLDLVVQARILDLLVEEVRRRHLGVLFVTHDMGVVARVADEVAVMEHGRIVERGPVERIFHAPAHPATRALVDAHLALYPEGIQA